ncbi:MAG: DUF4386 domain-containing protein [Legionellales bacterium]
MKNNNSINKTARIAGLLYLLNAVFAGFALYVRSSLFVSGDGAATVTKILASGMLFRIGIVSDLIGQVVQILMALTLYEVFKTYNKTYALLMAVLGLMIVPIVMLNQLNQFAILNLLGTANYPQVAFYVSQFSYGLFIAQIFFGLWLFPLGYLAFKSRYIPRILGILLIIAGFGYVIDSFGKFLFPKYNPTLAMFTFIGEVTFLLWLIIKGVNVRTKDEPK